MKHYKVGDKVRFEGRWDEIVRDHMTGAYDLRSGACYVRNYELEAGRWAPFSKALFEDFKEILRGKREKLMSEAKFKFGERVEVRFIGVIEGIERDPWNKQIVYKIRAQGDSLKCVIETASVSEMALNSAEDLEPEESGEPENLDVNLDWNQRNPRHAD